MSLSRKKSIATLLAQAAGGEKGLKRTLDAKSLVALGIGAIIGAGLFVRTAAASAEAAGAAVTLSFIVAAIGCAFAGLCYAEFAAMIPIAGSAYTYAYATMGEFVAWTIGWALILEYALGAATVSIAWSEYLNNLLGGKIPYEWCHSPLEVSASGVHGVFNGPALIILLLLTLLLIKGTQESASVNAVIVYVKVAIVLLFIVLVAAFTVLATLIMVVMEKRKDIAILKSMGATARSIGRIFILKGMIIGVVGTGLGTLGGWLGCWLLQNYEFVELPKDVFFVNTVPVAVYPPYFVAVIVATLVICLLATLYPARQAAALAPVDVIRYE